MVAVRGCPAYVIVMLPGVSVFHSASLSYPHSGTSFVFLVKKKSSGERRTHGVWNSRLKKELEEKVSRYGGWEGWYTRSSAFGVRKAVIDRTGIEAAKALRSAKKEPVQEQA